MSNKEIILGIDLGTTTSEACIYISKSKLKMIRNEDGNDIIESVVGFDDLTKEIVIGEDAGGTKNPIFEIKRQMGTNKKLTLGDKKVTPEVVSAEILKYIKKYSEESLGEKISRAVITVPANFNIKQREATIKAGEMAGFKVERIITEPTAAALAYCMENEKEEEFVKVMVYDLGGGTFDVSIGEFNNGVLQILGGDGDNQLGGGDFDRLLCDYICDDFQKQHGIDLRDDIETHRRVLAKAIKAKETLSTRKKVLIKEGFSFSSFFATNLALSTVTFTIDGFDLLPHLSIATILTFSLTGLNLSIINLPSIVPLTLPSTSINILPALSSSTLPAIL